MNDTSISNEGMRKPSPPVTQDFCGAIAETRTSAVNPFYRTRREPVRSPRYIELPIAPINASPVPHLTSLYYSGHAGNYGSREYPGNCDGNIIRDLILYFRPASVFDPMTGSGTCRDVCRELDLSCLSLDIHQGFDATDPAAYASLNDRNFEFIWAHPPYWRQKLYSSDPRDLSRTPSLASFLVRYQAFVRNCVGVLAPNGKLAVLMSDYQDREEGFVSLTYETKRIAFSAGLRPHCTDIVRFRHGASSSRKTYRSSFIPSLHDVCMVFERA